MKKMMNRVSLQGYLYQHKLELRTSGENSKNPGTQYISGTIDVATDASLTNIVTVHYTYVVPVFAKSGKSNRTFGILNDIINGKLKTVMGDGVDVAAKVQVDTSFDLNEFYNANDEFVSAKRNEGGFITVISAFSDDPHRVNEFEVDMVINGTRTIEADPDRNLGEKLILKGAIFNFANALLPVEFSVTNPGAIDYFASLEPSKDNIVFTRVRGKQISETVITKIEEDNAFGDTYVREVPRSRKDCVINWCQKEPYIWDDESTITAVEMKKAMEEREVHKAEIKRRSDEFKASQNTASATTSVASNNGFNF